MVIYSVRGVPLTANDEVHKHVMTIRPCISRKRSLFHAGSAFLPVTSRVDGAALEVELAAAPHPYPPGNGSLIEGSMFTGQDQLQAWRRASTPAKTRTTTSWSPASTWPSILSEAWRNQFALRRLRWPACEQAPSFLPSAHLKVFYYSRDYSVKSPS